MLTMPQEMMKVILPFVTLFSETVWDYAQILLMGAILAPGKRTVSATLTVMGLKGRPTIPELPSRPQPGPMVWLNSQ
jgi:hypothetical protein